MRVSRVSIGKRKLVYVAVADKRIKYAEGRSYVVYIGTTRKGLSRIAQSAAARAEDILSIHGVTEFTVRVITCQPRQNVRSWQKLERALLIMFRQMYGEPPLCNTQGKRMRETDEFEYFRKGRVQRILEELA